MNKKLVKVLSLAMVVFMLFAMSAVSVFAAGSDVITNSLGAYPYPYPLEGNRKEYCGWNERTNTPNSVWYNDSKGTEENPNNYVIKEATDGYYEGWSSSNPEKTGTHHPYGVGMHSAINFAPSTVYSIDNFKMTSFKTTVFLVQYDIDAKEGMMDVNPEAGTGNGQRAPIIVYLDLGKEIEKDGKKTIEWSQPAEEGAPVTYFMERSLDGKGNSVVLEADAEDLDGFTHIRIGIKTKHGIYRKEMQGEGEEAKEVDVLDGNTALASVYFADLEITQSEEVPLIEVPNIPERPTDEPEQENTFDVILPFGTDDANWFGRPYGAWKAGEDATLYYLSSLTYLSSSNTPNQTYSSGQPTTVNYPYGAVGTNFLFGMDNEEEGHLVENGIGMHPKKPSQKVFNRQDSWTVYNISAYTAEGSETPADTFYALVGLTSTANDWGSRLSSGGVYVYIYGDRTGDGQHYELLAASELVKGYTIGEFNVNIEGVKLLALDVILPEDVTDKGYGYSGVGFGNACLFMADENAVKPDYSSEKPAEDNWEEEGDVTTTPSTTPKATTTVDDGAKKNGCKGVVSGAAGVLFATVVAGAACFGKRRREE